MELFGKLVGKNRRGITKKLLEGFRQHLVWGQISASC